ncbi:unnamed protein product [Leptidea sinapis]|uniref:Uncharacterized protein n=1 Tax=Leptidea sinapis TaxID=189913 RepID=A0A5E4QCM0_9NEOP|nr:unnamed protein product [Leptidea sinapis]
MQIGSTCSTCARAAPLSRPTFASASAHTPGTSTCDCGETSRRSLKISRSRARRANSMTWTRPTSTKVNWLTSRSRRCSVR